MNDLSSVIRKVTAEAYDLADKTGRVPERIAVNPRNLKLCRLPAVRLR